MPVLYWEHIFGSRECSAYFQTYEVEYATAVIAVAWSPHGVYIASASEDQTVQAWEAVTGKKVFTYKGHSAPVIAVAWSPDGTRIASASEDQTVQIWSKS
ncbi:MAG TPA: hypothetical protein VKR06_40025 [Ktedonosporobacter sp.]|nr:hypothetical protein [Ktedonosporobacter sp.]